MLYVQSVNPCMLFLILTLSKELNLLSRNAFSTKCPGNPRSKQCGAYLLKKIHCRGSNPKVYPYLVYCYSSLVEPLSSLMSRSDFRNSLVFGLALGSSSCYTDIYEGKCFQALDGVPFLSVKNNLALMMNVDWFQPYDYEQYSVGAIYLLVMNLPRSERFKRENVMLIPGPHEPF